MFKKLLSSSSKKQFYISVVALVLTIVAVIAMVVVKNSDNQKIITADMIHSKEYETVESEDEGFDNCEFVKFTAFFTKDLDGNGTADLSGKPSAHHRDVPRSAHTAYRDSSISGNPAIAPVRNGGSAAGLS